MMAYLRIIFEYFIHSYVIAMILSKFLAVHLFGVRVYQCLKDFLYCFTRCYFCVFIAFICNSDNHFDELVPCHVEELRIDELVVAIA